MKGLKPLTLSLMAQGLLKCEPIWIKPVK